MDSKSNMFPYNDCGITKEHLQSIIKEMSSDDPEIQLRGSESAKNLINPDTNPCCQFLDAEKLIKSDIVPICVEFLSNQYNPILQFQAATIITHITSGCSELKDATIKIGAIPKLVNLLKGSFPVVEQALLSLVNITADNPGNRDLVLEAGVMTKILRILKSDPPIDKMRLLVWAIYNFCRTTNGPPPSYDRVKICLPLLAKVMTLRDDYMMEKICWILYYISRGCVPQKIQGIVDAGFVPKLVKLLDRDKVGILTAALNALSNISAGNNAQIYAVVQAGVLPFVVHLLSHPDLHVQNNATRIIANSCRGRIEVLRAVVETGALLALSDVMEKGNLETRRQAARGITNLTLNGTNDQIAVLFRYDIIQPFCALLADDETKPVVGVLKGLRVILSTAKKLSQDDVVAEMIVDCGGLKSLKILVGHPNEEVHRTSSSLIYNYFPDNLSE